MPSIENWWNCQIDWETPAGQLLARFAAALPAHRSYRITVFGSAPLQLTVDRNLLSGDVDIFSDDDEDLSEMIRETGLEKGHGGLYLEPSFELSFRASTRWRQRARVIQLHHVTFTFPHPLDILIGKLGRLDPKDLEAFKRVIQLTGHPTAEELIRELQNGLDLFRPAFDEETPNRYPENTQRLWQELYASSIDVRKIIIEPAIKKRQEGYGESPPDYKGALGR